ncbi:hypothetical protein CBR_g20078 [Chara braunii]|uniref:Reverse transcriptase domain-containing protein n=1 Tax=Chara braunii TaxID=69332 RepID=A0A388KZK7_CHABU|nr:hypothetical protein CBR_g20078 [Chara braunii]|eukprot:GBG75448.1 hypothetical protein CBR_g20078 [Chara braunii]
MDDYPMYGLLAGFSLWGTLWRLLFPLGFWPTLTCKVGSTRGGTSTTPYTKEEEEKMAAILQEKKEKKEAKKKALKEEQAAKLKKIEEEMAKEKERLKKEEEEKLKEVDEEEEGPPLQRSSGQPSSNTGGDLEKRISEWVVNLNVGEEEEVSMYIPQDQQEAAMKAWEAEKDPLKRQALEDEKRMEWKLAVMLEKKRRIDEAAEAAEALEEVKNIEAQLAAQPDLPNQMRVIARSVACLARVQADQYDFSRSQDIAVRSIRLGFRDFARELRCMNDLFRPWLDRFVIVYLDDILVFSKTLDEHQGHLRQVLEKLRVANFKINAKKCNWAKAQVLYLGHVLDEDGVKPEDSKIAAIRDWSTPRTLTELRSFLGLANYYRKFVRNFSTIAAPLRRLL